MILLIILCALRYYVSIHTLQLFSYKNSEYFEFFLDNKLKFTIGNQKKFVLTARSLRLISTVVIITTLLFMITPATLIFILLLNPLFTIASNYLIYPIEYMIQRYYIKKAKKKLSKYKPLIIGITGSYGKTSTKNILTSFLNEKYHVLMTPKSYNTEMGICKVINNELNEHHEVFICEMGATHIYDIKKIMNIINPSISMITSIGNQHLKTFGDIETIIKTKFEAVEYLNGIAFLNADDNNIRSYSIKNNIKKVYYGITKGSTTASNVNYTDGISFDLYEEDSLTASISTNLLGKHNLYNILGAISIARYLGVNKSAIKRVCRTLQNVENRLSIRTVGERTIIDDSFNSNEIGAFSALEVLSNYNVDKYIITPGIVELDDLSLEINSKFGYEANKIANKILIYGPLVEDIVSKVDINDNFIICSDFKEAYNKYLTISSEDSVLLIENDLPGNY